MKAQVKSPPTIYKRQVMEKSPQEEKAKLKEFLSNITIMLPAETLCLKSNKVNRLITPNTADIRKLAIL